MCDGVIGRAWGASLVIDYYVLRQHCVGVMGDALEGCYESTEADFDCYLSLITVDASDRRVTAELHRMSGNVGKFEVLVAKLTLFGNMDVAAL